ncbi:pyridoxamine 5'-phosphate oxidase family protein [Thermomonospora umbrina]|uniref:Pyridoxamine 5'-phosphate oxidase n=1 Tax=Thermomonospora umbrina TaxID=111806 RepID=A0A3D9SGL5_9ACTN|nr:pyridoxamine 5'-phosphate oxidase family protein [Thermomonospora umbrina]REE95042.1 pyridoxamine 5'-phosphate oxidase [Thermomonospora umbrina]
MNIDSSIEKVLADTRVLEFTTITRSGLNTRPMAGAWRPERGQILLTTPPSYAQKVLNVRHDGRVALLYSDFTGSGLSGSPAVMVQGTATAPDTVVAPQDILDYWRELFRRVPRDAEYLADKDLQASMDWYYRRLPIYVTPDRVHSFEAVPYGGDLEPVPEEKNTSMGDQIRDALGRYPTAVLAGRDDSGHPWSARATVAEDSGAGDLRVEPVAEAPGLLGPANLLWHRHNGESGDMLSLLVVGTADESDEGYRFRPERVPGALPSGHGEDSYQAWIDDGRRRSRRYLAQRGLAAPEIDWDALIACAP